MSRAATMLIGLATKENNMSAQPANMLIALAFRDVLREQLTPDEFISVLMGEKHPDDLLDANVAMSEAFKRVIGRHAYTLMDFEESDGSITPDNDRQLQSETDIFNGSYDFAMAELFSGKYAKTVNNLNKFYGRKVPDFASSK